ncbi:MAG: hypothetical protein IKV00_09925 [Clostridia bacterium]|nr:hypothetical protein [Clostridia bacterium]
MAKLNKSRLLRAMRYLLDEIDRIRKASQSYTGEVPPEWKELLDVYLTCFEACKAVSNQMKERE